MSVACQSATDLKDIEYAEYFTSVVSLEVGEQKGKDDISTQNVI